MLSLRIIFFLALTYHFYRIRASSSIEMQQYFRDLGKYLAWRLANRLLISYINPIIPVKFNFPSRCDRSARAA